MARGLGATYGVNTADGITSALTSYATQRSWALRFFTNSAGGSGGGRLFSHVEREVLAANGAVSSIQFLRQWSGGIARWTAGALSANTWYSVVVTYDSGSTANDPVIYIDGTSVTVTEATAPSGTLNTDAGAYIFGNRTGFNRYHDGMLAEVAVYDAILDAGEAAALGAGYSPLLVRPSALVEYIPMVRDNISRKLAVPTLAGTAVQPHPRIIMPRRRAAVAAVATGNTYTGTIAATLPALTASASGWVEATGAGVATLPSLTAAAQGALTFTGTAEATLPSLTADAAGTFAAAGDFTGTIAATLPALTATASGALTFSGAVEAILPALNADLSGWAEVTGSIIANLPSLSASAAGSGGEVAATANTGGWLPEHRQYTAEERRQRGLEWQKADPKELRAALEKAYAEAIGSPVEPDAEAAPIIEAIRPFAASGYDTPAPPVASVDWTAVAGNIAAIEALFDRMAEIRRRRLAAAAILLLSV